jgi:hypothetical protein
MWKVIEEKSKEMRKARTEKEKNNMTKEKSCPTDQSKEIIQKTGKNKRKEALDLIQIRREKNERRNSKKNKGKE